jgi:hypothetical protein
VWRLGRVIFALSLRSTPTPARFRSRFSLLRRILLATRPVRPAEGRMGTAAVRQIDVVACLGAVVLVTFWELKFDASAILVIDGDYSRTLSPQCG